MIASPAAGGRRVLAVDDELQILRALKLVLRAAGYEVQTAASVEVADLAGGVVMTLGRFVPILAMLALAGSLGPRRVAPPGLGTLRTDTPTFVIFLVGFVLIVAVLTFLTALVLAPFAQALSSHMF